MNIIFTFNRDGCKKPEILDKIFFIVPCIFFDRFNPETDVCELWDCHDGSVYSQKTEECNICIDWRPKNICELDPEAEGCICDEYQWKERCQEIIDFLEKPKIKELPENFTEELYEHEEEMLKICKIIYYPCISSHLPNECESGNPDWVWEEKKIYPQRVKFYCNKNYVECHIGDYEYYNKTWNDKGCTVPLIDVEEYITWLPCIGFIEFGEEYCKYSNKEHYEMNIDYIKNYAETYDCTYELMYWKTNKICKEVCQ